MNMQTTHRHEDGTEWIFSRAGTDNDTDNKQRYVWSCIKPDGGTDSYLCDKHGWVSIEFPPSLSELDVVFCNAKDRTRWMERWRVAEDDYNLCFATHWMPEPELPEKKL